MMQDDIKTTAPASPPEDPEVAAAPPEATSGQSQPQTAQPDQPPAEAALNDAKEPTGTNERQEMISEHIKNLKAEKEEHHLVPVALALLVLIILAAIAIVADMKKSDTQDNSSANTGSQQTGRRQNREAASGDQNQQTIDDSINTINSLPDEEDTSGQGLSDQNLGL